MSPNLLQPRGGEYTSWGFFPLRYFVQFSSLRSATQLLQKHQSPSLSKYLSLIPSEATYLLHVFHCGQFWTEDIRARLFGLGEGFMKQRKKLRGQLRPTAGRAVEGSHDDALPLRPRALRGYRSRGHDSAACLAAALSSQRSRSFPPPSQGVTVPWTNLNAAMPRGYLDRNTRWAGRFKFP